MITEIDRNMQEWMISLLQNYIIRAIIESADVVYHATEQGGNLLWINQKQIVVS